MTPVWFCPRKRHYRCNLCGPAAARKIPSSEQDGLYGLSRPREAFDRVPRKVIWWALRKLGVQE